MARTKALKKESRESTRDHGPNNKSSCGEITNRFEHKKSFPGGIKSHNVSQNQSRFLLNTSKNKYLLRCLCNLMLGPCASKTGQFFRTEVVANAESLFTYDKSKRNCCQGTGKNERWKQGKILKISTDPSLLPFPYFPSHSHERVDFIKFQEQQTSTWTCNECRPA